MLYLLDTHTLLWFLEGNDQLTKKVRKEIGDVNNKCFISIASLWEIAIKMKIDKLTLKFPFEELTNYLLTNDIELLPVAFDHLLTLMNLDMLHKDPFDRIIIAQGITESLTIITKDANFSLYNASVFW